MHMTLGKMNKLDKIKSFPNVTDKSRKFQVLEKLQAFSKQYLIFKRKEMNHNFYTMGATFRKYFIKVLSGLK